MSKVFLFFGRCEKEKGFHLLTELFDRFASTPDVSLIVCGTGSLVGDLPVARFDETIKTLVDNVDMMQGVVYLGRQSQQNIQQLLSLVDYTLMPSIMIETFGLSALESITAGVPVVGYKKGGLEQFIPESCSIGNEGDVGAIREKILDLSSSESLEYSKLKARIGEIAQEFKPTKWVETFKSYMYL